MTNRSDPKPATEIEQVWGVRTVITGTLMKLFSERCVKSAEFKILSALCCPK